MLIKTLTSILICLVSVVYADPIRLEVLKGPAINNYTQEFANLCHIVYGEYPYLYDGHDAGYEAYISSYADSSNSIVCLAFDGDDVVGAASGMPLIESRDYYQAPFLAQGIDITPMFYLSELILLKDYRGKGIGENLYTQIETLVRENGCFSKMTCCNIQVAKDDPNMPKNYKYIDYPLWVKLGFYKHPEISYDSYWTNIGDENESAHRLVFWIKEL